MTSKRASRHKILSLFTCFFLLITVVLLTACASSASENAASSSAQMQPKGAANTNSTGGSSQQSPAQLPSASKSTDSTSQSSGPAYLIKTLKVTMNVQDTRQTASTMSSWISATDPRSTSAGAHITQSGDAANAYEVVITYDVQASLYPKIYAYLRDYNLQKGVKSRLEDFDEGVQDVTNDYIDTQSRIKNYKGEQARLLTFLGQTKNITDVISIETELTNVEGNIETSEAHLNLLANQVTYYTVTIDLQPFPSTPVPQATTGPGWSFVQVVGSAFAASLEFGRNLLTFLIWILAFAIYIVPILIIAFLIRKYYPRLSMLFTDVKPVQRPTETK
jgi:Domain of unknown function (DUF4349)